MRWQPTKKISTRSLLRSEHLARTQVRRPITHWIGLLVALLLLAGASAYVGRATLTAGARHQDQALREDNQKLKEQLEKNQAQAQQDLAMRNALAKQISSLSSEVKGLQNELAFLKKRKEKSSQR